MIAINELRIGNLVMCAENQSAFISNDDRIVKIVGLSGHVAHWNKNDRLSSGTKYEFLEGIPLSPEILKKCGFYFDSQMWHINHDFLGLLSFEFAGDTITVWVSRKDFGHCQYLHQLQNLYFSLTSTELTINL